MCVYFYVRFPREIQLTWWVTRRYFCNLFDEGARASRHWWIEIVRKSLGSQKCRRLSSRTEIYNRRTDESKVLWWRNSSSATDTRDKCKEWTKRSRLEKHISRLGIFFIHDSSHLWVAILSLKSLHVLMHISSVESLWSIFIWSRISKKSGHALWEMLLTMYFFSITLRIGSHLTLECEQLTENKRSFLVITSIFQDKIPKSAPY